jgi:hypothetical protein
MFWSKTYGLSQPGKHASLDSWWLCESSADTQHYIDSAPPLDVVYCIEQTSYWLYFTLTRLPMGVARVVSPTLGFLCCVLVARQFIVSTSVNCVPVYLRRREAVIVFSFHLTDTFILSGRQLWQPPHSNANVVLPCLVFVRSKRPNLSSPAGPTFLFGSVFMAP